MADSVIQTIDLTKEYRGFGNITKHRALDGLNLEIQRGEIFGLLGPNGSGKTTTMKLLLGLLFPTRGSATVLGRKPTDVEAKQRIGFLPEESYLYRFLNADETLDFYGRLFGLPRKVRTERIDRLIKLLGMDKARRRPLREYSKGMARRIGFASALINDPELVFLDEPTSGLDPIVSRQLKDLIFDLKKQGKTVVMTSHLLADIEDVCDRIAILHEGKLRKIGTVEDLLRVPDRLTVTIQDVPRDRREALLQAIAAAGGDVLSVGHPSVTLEELFIRTIRESTDGADPGRR
mgnify:CR=1 FL=1